ncbi:type VI secretion system Vgr family protein [Rhodopila globiformis]|nr:type VI secretion system tip protein TssI/VgrG [Rhodopila globiformis]
MTSPLGGEVLIPTRLSAQEGISQTFTFEVQVVSQAGAVDPNALLSHAACVTLQSDNRPIRYFHGIVHRISSEGMVRGRSNDEYHVYRLLLVPRLWFLDQTTDCRVFQELSVPDILTQLFNDAGLKDFSLPRSDKKREYTVQFNETDLAFATRLMEEEGYYYFFEHSASGHKLIVADQGVAFKDIPDAALHLSGANDPATITAWSHVARTVRGKMRLKDYDPENPDALLQADKNTKLKTSGKEQRDDFRWPAYTVQSGTLDNRTQWEMEAAEAQAHQFQATSHFGTLVPGGKFKLSSRPASQYDGTYVVRSVNHEATDDSWLTQNGTVSYENSFICFPATITWRQPMVTPRPRMQGIHAALVLGPQHTRGTEIRSQDGEEIHTDSLGRVKVRFYWDHRADAAGGQAIWARVVQPWAGKGWGAQFIPRVGTEVAVSFVNGDPDCPIIVGGLYNGRDTPIFAEGEKTRLGFRTRSTLKGGKSNFSEFSIDDKSGQELVFLHAEKDLTTEVENDQATKVGHDQTLTVDNCRIVTVKKDETIEITQNRSVTIDQGNDALDIRMGNLSIKADAGKIEISALQSVTLTVGGNSIKIDQEGVAINGIMVKVAGQAMTDVSAPMTKISGDGMLTLKGGIMMLN